MIHKDRGWPAVIIQKLDKTDVRFRVRVKFQEGAFAGEDPSQFANREFWLALEHSTLKSSAVISKTHAVKSKGIR